MSWPACRPPSAGEFASFVMNLIFYFMTLAVHLSHHLPASRTVACTLDCYLTVSKRRRRSCEARSCAIVQVALQRVRAPLQHRCRPLPRQPLPQVSIRCLDDFAGFFLSMCWGCSGLLAA